MLRCINCTMTETRPDTPFVDGVCGACLNRAIRPTIDWEERKQDLLRLLDRFDGKVLVPSSGGKDSTFIVLALRELGATVTTVTAMTCHPTEIGLANLDNLERYAPGIRVEPDRVVRAKMNRLGLQLVGDISYPEHVAIFTVPWQVAIDTGHRLLMWGENPQNQYGGPTGTDQAKQMTTAWNAQFGGQLGLRPSDLVGQDGISEEDMRMYTLPPESALQGIESHFLGQYMAWDGYRNAQIANKAGLRQILPSATNYWLGENLDNAQTGLHDHFGFLKFGYGRGCAQASMDIREGRTTREKVMRWLREHEGLWPASYMGVMLEEILARIEVTPEQFLAIANKFMVKSLFVEDHIEWGQRLTLKEFA